MAPEPEPIDPPRLAELMRRASGALKRTDSIKRYARVQRLSYSRGSRHVNSDDAHTFPVQLLAAVERLASGDYASAMPLLLESFAVALEAMRKRTTRELERRLRECELLRIERQAVLDRCRVEEYERGQADAGAATDDARLGLAEIDTELVALRRVLRERETEGR